MNNKFKLLFLAIPSLVLSSCRYGLKEIYIGQNFNSPIFEENYYRKWDSSLSRIDNRETYNLTANDKVFTTYNEFLDLNIDLDAKNKGLNYKEDYETSDVSLVDIGYGPTKKMTRIDSSFKKGYISKLFDGQMFCNGKFQLARVQIDHTGFGKLFEKEVQTSNDSYFALNFKAACDYTRSEELGEDIKPHESSLDLIVSFYMKNNKNNFDVIDTKYHLTGIPTNPSESHENPTNTTLGTYIFFGFKFNFDIDHLQGISIRYENLTDPYVDRFSDNNLSYSLMLYEMMMPFTTWL